MVALLKGVDHMKSVIATQQAYAKVAGMAEVVSLVSLIDDTLQLNAMSFTQCGIDLGRAYDLLPPVLIDKHKVLQILMNLLSNARHAVKWPTAIYPQASSLRLDLF